MGNQFRLGAVFLAFMMMLASGAAAHAAHAQDTDVEPRPGLVTANSVAGVPLGPLAPAAYQLDVQIDMASVRAGQADAGNVAFERASEVRAAGNDTAARNHALQEMNEIAAIASSNDTKGLDKAAAILTELQNQLPEAAQPGLSTALDNIQQAKDRAPTEVPIGPPNMTGADRADRGGR